MVTTFPLLSTSFLAHRLLSRLVLTALLQFRRNQTLKAKDYSQRDSYT